MSGVTRPGGWRRDEDAKAGAGDRPYSDDLIWSCSVAEDASGIGEIGG